LVYSGDLVLKKSSFLYSELEARSNFTFLCGGSHPEELIERAAELGYRAIALTDRHTLAGIVRAHCAAKNAGIQFIPGCRIELFDSLPPAENARASAAFSLLLYPTDRASYGRMSSLLTTGKMRAPKGECLLDLDDLERHQHGLLAVLSISQPDAPRLEEQLLRIKRMFDDDRLSLSISSSYAPGEKKKLRALLALTQRCRIPPVVTNDVYYHSPERRPLQDALTCIRLGCTIREAGFALLQNAERSLKPPKEMQRLFAALPTALARNNEIAERCSGFSLDHLTYHYPKEICPENTSPVEYLRQLVIAGAKERYPQGIPKKVALQVKHELQLIRELDYEKYFLTVQDLVAFARSQGILCQGRGAAANSAVCYMLGITSVDPAVIPLMVERFISKERNEPPDIDIDFEHERREEVIQYIYRKYGRRRAALTAEVICYRRKSSIRDIAKVFGFNEDEITLLSKIRRRTQEQENPAQLLRERLREAGFDPDSRPLELTFKLADILRSFPRHLSQHVGGFIISDPPLSEIVPIENAAMPDRTVIEWDKDDIERLGMLKVDVLGLGMLTCIRKTLEFVNTERSQSQASEPELSLYNIPREDPAVYQMISRADTIGVFQIESRAQMSMLPRLKPKCFYDLVIEVAIVRPGPIQGGMVHPYLRRRSGLEKIRYPSEDIQEILGSTLGIPIFQEQVMQIAVKAANFTPGEADGLRRAMAGWKKNANALFRFERRLKDGMREKGYDEAFSHQIFEQMKGFGDYGFPQSHAASFAHLVYVSAWLKHYHPAAFAAGLLNSMPMGFYQPAQIVRDAEDHGVIVQEADVHFSSWDCKLEPGKKQDTTDLRLGLRLVRGLRREQAEKIPAAVKSSGPFRSIRDLWRVSRIRVEQLKRLADADAFRSMGLDRQQALWQIKKLRDEHLPLFEGVEEEQEPLPDLPALSKQMQVFRDYQTVGLSLKTHPMSFLRLRLSQQGVLTMAEFKTAKNNSRAAIAGLILLRQRPQTASGTLFMTLEDETGMANLIIRPEILSRFQTAILDAVFLAVRGKTQHASGVRHLLVEQAADISAAYPDWDSTSRDFR
jgi:error-prone DNA polymerase